MVGSAPGHGFAVALAFLAFTIGGAARAQSTPPTATPSAPAEVPASAPAEPSPAPRVQAAPAPMPEVSPSAPVTARRVRVDFNADDPAAVLESDLTADGRATGWHIVCNAPCSEPLVAQGSFRVAGRDIAPSRPFELPDRPQVRITAETETSSQGGPLALLIVGYGLATIVGPIVLVFGVAAETVDSRGAGAPLLATGGVITLGGLVMGTVGLVQLVSRNNAESTVRLGKSAPGSTTVSLGPRGFTF